MIIPWMFYAMEAFIGALDYPVRSLVRDVFLVPVKPGNG